MRKLTSPIISYNVSYTHFRVWIYLLLCLICPPFLFSTPEAQKTICMLLLHVFCYDFKSTCLMDSVCLTTGLPRPSCRSIISALARMIFPPWVIMDCLSQVTKSGRLSSYIHKKIKTFSLLFSKLKSKPHIQKVPLEFSGLPHISAGVYVQSHGGLFLPGLQSDDRAYMCIWGLLVGHYKALHPDSSNLRK